jgi:hypothetical protein
MGARDDAPPSDLLTWSRDRFRSEGTCNCDECGPLRVAVIGGGAEGYFVTVWKARLLVNPWGEA